MVAQVLVTDTSITVHTRQPARRVCTAFLVVMTLALAGVITACGGSSVAVPKPLSDALTIMQESGGYSFSATIATGASSVTTTGDFQAPNRIAANRHAFGIDASGHGPRRRNGACSRSGNWRVVNQSINYRKCSRSSKHVRCTRITNVNEGKRLCLHLQNF